MLVRGQSHASLHLDGVVDRAGDGAFLDERAGRFRVRILVSEASAGGRLVEASLVLQISFGVKDNNRRRVLRDGGMRRNGLRLDVLGCVVLGRGEEFLDLSAVHLLDVRLLDDLHLLGASSTVDPGEGALTAEVEARAVALATSAVEAMAAADKALATVTDGLLASVLVRVSAVRHDVTLVAADLQVGELGVKLGWNNLSDDSSLLGGSGLGVGSNLLLLDDDDFLGLLEHGRIGGALLQLDEGH